MKNAILVALRSSEFWVAVCGAIIEVAHEPVPTMDKVFVWGYVAARLLSKIVQFIFPNPANPAGAWFSNDAARTARTAGAIPAPAPAADPVKKEGT